MKCCIMMKIKKLMIHDPEGGDYLSQLTKEMFTAKTDLYETPQDLFDKLNKKFHFDLDVCALPENTKCEMYYTPEDDGLTQPWWGSCWMNPPYGREISKWVEKAYKESLKNTTVVCLLPARTDTKWFHEYCLPFAEIRFLKGRLRFQNCKHTAPFPNMIVIFRAVNPCK